MKERPILFSSPMVRAILRGENPKTQTRRVVKPIGNDEGFVILDYGNGGWPYRSDDGDSTTHTVKRGGKLYLDETPHVCPYGQPGDRLWVRESFAAHWMYNSVPPSDARSVRCDLRRSDNLWYAADADKTLGTNGAGSLLRGKWRPSIHMPRWASRILLEVVSVRVERLQVISEADALAEGIESLTGDNTIYHWDFPKPRPNHAVSGYKSACSAYKELWCEINGRDSWDANPWVWVVEFKRLEGGAA